MARIWLLLFVGLLVACGTTSKKSDVELLEATLTGYAKVMRWGEVDQAIAYIDPEVLAVHPIASVELERFRQIQIAGYREQPVELVDETHARQIVQIELINRHTQAVRSIIDRQEWRLDREKKRWWLSSGLPKIAEDR